MMIYLLYDSINNSVFASQVWTLLLKQIEQKKVTQIHLISFEKQIQKHHYHHPQIKITQILRWPYLGKISLWYNLWKLHSYLPNTTYQVMARGPFAGWLALKILDHRCNQATIQVRGLAAAEYLYAHNSSNLFKHTLKWLRAKQLLNLEQSVYSQSRPNLILECVSPAMQQHLHQVYHANPSLTTIAKLDLPVQISPALRANWRVEKRQFLKINSQATVYCYSGSAHPWQCPVETITFFKTQLASNANAFLLILTNEPAAFQKLIGDQLPKSTYGIWTVPHHEIYQYLAAADFGLLFRKADLVNWVSRPTKALEYRAVGLKILHNHTVAYLNSM